MGLEKSSDEFTIISKEDYEKFFAKISKIEDLADKFESINLEKLIQTIIDILSKIEKTTDGTKGLVAHLAIRSIDEMNKNEFIERLKEYTGDISIEVIGNLFVEFLLNLQK